MTEGLFLWLAALGLGFRAWNLEAGLRKFIVE